MESFRARISKIKQKISRSNLDIFTISDKNQGDQKEDGLRKKDFLNRKNFIRIWLSQHTPIKENNIMTNLDRIGLVYTVCE